MEKGPTSSKRILVLLKERVPFKPPKASKMEQPKKKPVCWGHSYCQGRCPSQELPAASSRIKDLSLPRQLVHVLTGDPALSPDGKRTGPVRQLYRLSHKLILLRPCDAAKE